LSLKLQSTHSFPSSPSFPQFSVPVALGPRPQDCLSFCIDSSAQKTSVLSQLLCSVPIRTFSDSHEGQSHPHQQITLQLHYRFLNDFYIKRHHASRLAERITQAGVLLCFALHRILSL
jgi:hypothetical protein